MTNDSMRWRDFCYRNIMSQNKVTDYFMLPAIENNVKKNKRKKYYDHRKPASKKKAGDSIIELHNFFHPADFCFPKTKIGDRQHSCQALWFQ